MATESPIERVTLHITDCAGCDKHNDNRTCGDFFKILELIKAFRRESQDEGYEFEVLKKVDMPFSIQINKDVKIKGEKFSKPSPLAINVCEIQINLDSMELTRDFDRIDAYYTVRYKNGETRLVIIKKSGFE